MLLGYNTNGLAHHDLIEALELLADIGCRSVAITLDHGALNPFAPQLQEQLSRVSAVLQQTGMRSVIETGARFLLDPRIKHEPTLMSTAAAGRAKRIDFYRRAIEIAAQLGSDCVSIWSGILRESLSDEQSLDRLAGGLRKVLDEAEQADVSIGFEPEPGMFIDTMASFTRLLQWIDHPRLQLTLDIGHLYCQGEVPIVDYLDRWAPKTVNIHIEDMRAGVHEHLMFGEGEMDFSPIMASLAKTDYTGGVHIELSRHGHDGAAAARRAFEFLQPLIPRSSQ